MEQHYFRRPIGPPGRIIAKKSARVRRLLLRFFLSPGTPGSASRRLQEPNRKSPKLPRSMIILSDISL